MSQNQMNSEPEAGQLDTDGVIVRSLKREDLEQFRAWIAEGQRLDECILEWRKLSLEAVERALEKARGRRRARRR